MKELTLDEAMRLHKELYLSMSKIKNYGELLGKGLYAVKKYCLNLMGFGDENECPKNHCFLCEYAWQQRCKNMPDIYYYCFHCPVFCKNSMGPHCTQYADYIFLDLIFDNVLETTRISYDNYKVIRMACIKISELRPDTFT